MSSRSSFTGVRAFEVEFEFESVCFGGGRKTGEPGEKALEQELDKNQQQNQDRKSVV